MNLSREHGRLMRLASAAALATALILVAAKAFAWWQSGSVSLLAGLTDSLLDGAASACRTSTTTVVRVQVASQTMPSPATITANSGTSSGASKGRRPAAGTGSVMRGS